MMQGNHFSKLSAFVAVAEHRHFSQAVPQRDISPSALTQAIRARGALASAPIKTVGSITTAPMIIDRSRFHRQPWRLLK